MSDAVPCPWCGYRSRDTYKVQLHIEERHTEDSPFVVTQPSPKNHRRGGRSSLPFIDDRSSSSGSISPRVLNGSGYARPSVSKSEKAPSSKAPSDKAPSEKPPSSKATSHVSTSKSSASKKSGSSRAPSTKASSVSSSSSAPPKDPLKDPQNGGRLGTKELGPYAFEKSMPAEVRKCLENASKPSYECRIGPNGKLVREGIIYKETPRPVPLLADLSALDPEVVIAYFCHKGVKHVQKLKCDGNFCGYWNIQMLLSYRLAKVEDPAHGSLPLPNVLDIQDTVEAAWNRGICTFGRTETGGIRNTRKWIGTHEAAAYFLYLGQPVTALAFRTSSKNPEAPPAHERLLDYVEAYFISGLEHSIANGSSRITDLPPIYFQRPGHSMTIVGMERKVTGERVLLVFDPSFPAKETLKELGGGKVPREKAQSVMAAYRQDVEKLAKYKEYEILIPQAQR